MATTKHTSVRQYLDALPADRRDALEAVRDVINANLDPAIEEGIQYNMPGWFIPHSVYPKGYHCDASQPLPFVQLASQKNHMAVYLFCLYCDPDAVARFKDRWTEGGRRLDMGASCVRFKKLEAVSLEAIGEAVASMTAARFIEAYEANLTGSSGGFKQKPAARTSSKEPAERTTKKPVRTPAKRTGTTAGKKIAKNVSKKTSKKSPGPVAQKATKTATKKTTKSAAKKAAKKTSKNAPARKTSKKAAKRS